MALCLIKQSVSIASAVGTLPLTVPSGRRKFQNQQWQDHCEPFGRDHRRVGDQRHSKMTFVLNRSTLPLRFQLSRDETATRRRPAEELRAMKRAHWLCCGGALLALVVVLLIAGARQHPRY